MKKFIIDWIISVKEKNRLEKIKEQKDTEQVISDVLKHIEQRRKVKAKSDDYIF